ncbi:MAG: NifB/NifX family molybdenum-iron cluster-binding protein [Deltaproteobacteria bacterium]|nr:NifB/NifX family molybdenum-iron cluster-binding protein [Candidatus Anaeroferrophillus wilburensis]MBN2889138.1 NifB/NifX family molybdenum-iron cluster-binding protein [Deltaproteobacteria bacterium]
MKKIALAANDMNGLDGEMSMHFGRCPAYVVAYVNDNNNLDTTEIVENPYFGQHVPGQVPAFIKSLAADVIIAGGMGPKAIDMFQGFGIDVVTGVGGRVGNVLQAYLDGKISGAASCGHDHDH